MRGDAAPPAASLPSMIPRSGRSMVRGYSASLPGAHPRAHCARTSPLGPRKIDMRNLGCANCHIEVRQLGL